MIDAIFTCVAGLDIHKKLIVCTMLKEQVDGQLSEETREFGTTKKAYQELAKWLSEAGVQTAVMESTGIYWKRPYAELEAVGLTTLVVNARHVKQVPGRKTDVKDSQWLVRLARYGLLRGSFIPEKDLRELRLVTRYHSKLVSMIASEKNRLHKLLDDAGIRLGNVLTDVNGVSAKAMIDGLIRGESVDKLLTYVRGSLKKKLSELREVLTDTLSARHCFILKQIRGHIEQMEAERQELESYIYESMQPYQQAWEFLQTIPGFDAMSAAKLLVEIGVDMTQFGTSEQLCSWAGMCPGNNESAGKKFSGKTRKANSHVKRILCESAHAAAKTRSQFKGHYQGLIIRRGHKKAIIAVGHKLLRVAYCLLSKKQHYVDPDIDYETMMVQRNAPRWLKSLQKFGYLH